MKLLCRFGAIEWHNQVEEERELVALLLFSYGCLVIVNVLRLFLTVSWVGPQCVIVVFPDHTHSLFNLENKNDYGKPIQV